MNLVVKDIKLHEKQLEVSKSDTIAYGKTKLGYTPVDGWNFKFDGEILENNKKFGDYDIDEGDILFVSKKVVGGQI